MRSPSWTRRGASGPWSWRPTAGRWRPCGWRRTHPDRVASLGHRQRHGAGGRGGGLRLRGVRRRDRRGGAASRCRWSTATCPRTSRSSPRAWRTGWASSEWWGRAARRGASPATAAAFNLVTFTSDMRGCLPDISCPTLIFARARELRQPESSTAAISRITSRARAWSRSPGPTSLPWAGEFDSIVDDMEEFVTGTRGEHAATRLLSTVLFTDIVDSTVRAAAAGDREWRGGARRVRVNVARLLARHDGVLVKNTGDGILARFPTPAQGVRCAAAMVDAAGRSGSGAARRVCTPARWSCGATTSAGWPCTSRRG